MDNTPPKFFVYEVLNTNDGTVYVGKAEDPEVRWRTHLKMATHPLYVAIATHGTGSFDFRVVEEHTSSHAALVAESQRIKKYARAGQSLYNRSETTTERGRRVYIKWVSRDKTPAAEFVWNEHLCVTSNGSFVTKYKGASGKWHNKRIPKKIVDAEEARAWFRQWLSTADEAELLVPRPCQVPSTKAEVV